MKIEILCCLLLINIIQSHNGVDHSSMIFQSLLFQLLVPKPAEIFNVNDLKDQDLYKMTLAFDNYPVPAQETTYICKMFNIAEMAQAQTQYPASVLYHAIAFENNYDNLSKYPDLIQHIIISSCPSSTKWQDGYFGCKRLPISFECQNTIYVSSKGVNFIKYPIEAGMLWGGTNQNLVVAQIHYNNPQKIKGILDSTSIYVYYTPNMRKYDVGLQILGKNIPYIPTIPAGQSITYQDVCDSECFVSKRDSINIFDVFFHGHMTLKKIRTEITFANGVQDVTSMVNDYFYGDFQYLKHFNPPLVIEQPYKLKTICYNENKNSYDVRGGFGKRDEMCFAILHFYPRENGFLFCGETLGCTYFSERTLQDGVEIQGEFYHGKETVDNLRSFRGSEISTGYTCKNDV